MSFLCSAQLDPAFQMFWKYLDNHCRKSNPPGTSPYANAISLLPQTPPEAVPKSTDDAFSILLDIMISCFGPTPQDVIFGLYNFCSHTELHNRALSVQWQQLEDSVQEIITTHQFPSTTSSHSVISINPTGEIGGQQVWRVGFKSTYIKEQLSEQYIATSENEVRSFIKQFLSVPQGKGLAGSLFEPLVHWNITEGTGKWSFYKMLGSKVSESVKFVYDPSAEETCGFPI